MGRALALRLLRYGCRDDVDDGRLRQQHLSCHATTTPLQNQTRLQFQRLHELLDRGNHRADFRHRIQGLELLADVPHAWPAGLLDERKRAIRQCLEKHRLAISNVNGFMMNAVADPRQPYWHPSWIEPDPHYRAIRREHTKRTLRLAKELAAPSIQTEPGGPLEAGPVVARGRRIFYDEIMPCVELAEQLEVFLLIEPEPGLMIETFEQYLEFAGRIGSPWVGLNFDVGHAFCIGPGPAAMDRPHGAAHQALPPGRHRRHAASTPISCPAAGRLTFRPFCGKLPPAGYQGWLTVELYPYIDDPDAAGREAKRFLEERD